MPYYSLAQKYLCRLSGGWQVAESIDAVGIDLIARARSFAITAHCGQIRNNKSQEPYENHLREVAELVEQSGGSEAEIAGAWLHDSVEDTSATFVEIVELFGEEVGDLVGALTDPLDFSGCSTLDRKTRQAARVGLRNRSVKRVKLADQISNMRCVAVDPPLKWSKQKCIDYIEGMRRVAMECRGISELLDREFQIAYQKAIQAYP